MSRMRRQSGTSIVEAAFTIPILLMFLLGIVEFGRAYNEYQVLTNAAREAARYAVAPAQGTSNLPTDAASVATQWAQSAGITLAQTPQVTSTSCGYSINGSPQICSQVVVTAPYNFLAPQLLFGSNALSVNMTTTATMRQETN
jgi:Flp pilus assembly protein TadG